MYRAVEHTVDLRFSARLSKTLIRVPGPSRCTVWQIWVPLRGRSTRSLTAMDREDLAVDRDAFETECRRVMTLHEERKL